MNKNFLQGFTLVEILVVIAIIAILSSVMIGSFVSTREKAGNTSVKSYLWQARTQAELFYVNNNQTYSGVCSNQAIVLIIAGALSAGGDGGAVNARCFAISNEWAANSSLKAPEGTYNYWCVDSTGKSKGEPTELSGSTRCA